MYLLSACSDSIVGAEPEIKAGSDRNENDKGNHADKELQPKLRETCIILTDITNRAEYGLFSAIKTDQTNDTGAVEP